MIDFRVEQEDTVYPMVPAGADLHAMIRRPNPIAETGLDESSCLNTNQCRCIHLRFTSRIEPGVLNRVASLFRRRGFNIHSLAVGHSEIPGVSRMTAVVETDEAGAQRIQAHLYKLVNVSGSKTSRRGRPFLASSP